MDVRCRNSLLAGTVTLLILSSPLRAKPRPSPPPWELTLEERLHQRFDPAALKARAARRAAEQQAAARWFPSSPEGPFAARSTATDSSEHLTETVDGNQAPELFLPLELFDHLLLMGFPPEGKDQAETRRIIENRAVPLGFGRDFWQRLGAAAGTYLAVQKQRQPGKRLSDSSEDISKLDAEDLLRCRARKEAFAAAEAEFGEKNLRRLLYIGVAPGFSITYAIDDVTEHSHYLRFLEGGCQ